MSIQVKHSGTWKTPDSIQVKHAGTWKTPDSIKVKTSGAWQQVWPDVLTFEADSVTATVGAPGSVQAGYKFTSTGLYVEDNNASETTLGNWITPTSLAPGTYEIRLTVLSGSVPTTGPGTGTWLALSTTREWLLEATGGVQTVTGSWRIEVRDNGGPVLRSKDYNVTVRLV